MTAKYEKRGKYMLYRVHEVNMQYLFMANIQNIYRLLIQVYFS